MKVAQIPALRMFKYRDRTTIITDILKAVKTKREAKKTQIMELARLNYAQTNKYVSYLIKYGYLAVTERQTYVVTEKGMRFLYMIEMQRIHVIR